VILAPERPVILAPVLSQTLESVLIMESRSSRTNAGGWERLYRAGGLHVNLSFKNGVLRGQVASANRLALSQARIGATRAVGSARLETEFGSLESHGEIDANGEFVVALEGPALYPLNLRLVARHGLEIVIADLELF
jgi:hypothetical protein